MARRKWQYSRENVEAFSAGEISSMTVNTNEESLNRQSPVLLLMAVWPMKENEAIQPIL